MLNGPSLVDGATKPNKTGISNLRSQRQKEKGGNIYIGDIPKQLTESKTKGKCKVNDNQWGCEIKDFYYGKYHIFRIEKKRI